MTTNKKNHGIVLITGASSGIGRELALEFGARAETLVWWPGGWTGLSGSESNC
jgi:NADP-dependent 3-hydroxy acid dehydrogenase YdfG